MHPEFREVTQEKNKDLGSDFSIAHIKAESYNQSVYYEQMGMTGLKGNSEISIWAHRVFCFPMQKSQRGFILFFFAETSN